MRKNILINAVVPHPPIIIPEIGGTELEKVNNTVNALKKLSEELVQRNPDTVIIVTPHSAFNPYFFTAYSGEKIYGNFVKFGQPNAEIEFDNDIEFLNELNSAIKNDFAGFKFLPDNAGLDHGSCVPLYYLHKAGFKNKVIVINYCALGKKEHNLMGQRIAEVSEKLDRKIAFIASGDLSHKLIPTAPAGFDSQAYVFDDLIVKGIETGNYDSIKEITSEIRETAGECGYNSLMVAFGISNGKPIENEVLSYEAPFGVGYIVAML